MQFEAIIETCSANIENYANFKKWREGQVHEKVTNEIYRSARYTYQLGLDKLS